MSDEILPVEADLTLLRAPVGNKRRQFRRHRCSLATMAKLQLASVTEPRVTWVHNLSQGGVGLTAPQAIEAGLELMISFRNGKANLAVPAKVIFCQATADRSWRIGCAFATPITPETLETLLS